jgi:hypothetical protein
MEKRIKKIQLLNELEKFSGNNEVLINVIFFRYNK